MNAARSRSPHATQGFASIPATEVIGRTWLLVIDRIAGQRGKGLIGSSEEPDVSKLTRFAALLLEEFEDVLDFGATP